MAISSTGGDYVPLAPRPGPPRRTMRAVALPLVGAHPDEWGELRLAWPLTAEEWFFVTNLIAMMRPGFVHDEPAKRADDGDGG
jgi:hypothetical protein